MDMDDLNEYLECLTCECKAAFRERLLYMGLQGSYLRGEANENSDIDIMVILDRFSVRDMDTYRGILKKIGSYEKSCGFICGKEEMCRWNPLEVCQLLHTTKDLVGSLTDYLPVATKMDEVNYVKLRLGNLYHEICHRYIHADRAKNVSLFRGTCKGLFFLIQNLRYLETGRFAVTKAELLEMSDEEDRRVLKLSELPDGFDFDQAFSTLFAWMQRAFARIDGLTEQKEELKIETDRLLLDSVKESDKEDYFNNISHDKKVLETFICRYAETLEDFDFSAYLTAYQENNRLFAIRLKETGRLIGILISFDETEDSCEIGYGIGSRYWGQGYATEAVRRFLKYLLFEKGFRTVYASFFPGNDASRHVMEKCGMVYDHVSEKELTYLGAERDLTYYAIRRKTRALLLNGPSSAGKSSIAKVLQRRLRERQEDAVIVSLDDYLQMSGKEPIWEDDVFAVMPHMCADASAVLQAGKMLIVDHVITSPRILQALLDAVPGFQMKTVLVSCPVETLRKREADRGDRCIGSAEASLAYLYPQIGYDLCLDSSTAGPEYLAEMIMSIL